MIHFRRLPITALLISFALLPFRWNNSFSNNQVDLCYNLTTTWLAGMPIFSRAAWVRRTDNSIFCKHRIVCTRLAVVVNLSMSDLRSVRLGVFCFRFRRSSQWHNRHSKTRHYFSNKYGRTYTLWRIRCVAVVELARVSRTPYVLGYRVIAKLNV